MARPRRVVITHDPIPGELFLYVPCYDPRYHQWHVRTIYELLVKLSYLHMVGESDAVAVAVVYTEAANIDLLASPEQSEYLRRCYGSTGARVTTGLMIVAADYLGFDKTPLTIIRPGVQVEPQVESV